MTQIGSFEFLVKYIVVKSTFERSQYASDYLSSRWKTIWNQWVEISIRRFHFSCKVKKLQRILLVKHF